MPKIIFLLLTALLLPPAAILHAEGVAAKPAVTDTRDRPAVELYVTAGCPWCKKAIKYLQDKKVAFSIYDVEKDPEALQRFVRLNPRGGVPLARIGGQLVLGFDPQTYARVLGFSAESSP